MKVFGLTGGIGMGKSTVAEVCRAWGISVIDSDDLAREIVEPGQPALKEIARAFGKEILQPDGRLDRGRLARIVFSNSDALKMLEAITHPRITAGWRKRLQEWRGAGKIQGVIVIPLLFEIGVQEEMDSTICIACSEKTQQERLRKRDWSPAQIAQRIAAQWPVERKMAQANYVLWSEGGMEVLENQLDRIFGCK